MAMTFNGANFESEVMSSKEPVLVDFWAAWCGPCKMLTPTIEELAKDFEGKAKVGKINVDENQDIATRFSVMSIPTIILFKDGKIAEQFVGVQPKSVFTDALNKLI